MNEDETVDEQETVYGLDIAPLLDNEIPLEAIVICKVLTPDGESALSIRHTDGLTDWDRVGMLTMALDRVRSTAQGCWVSDDEDDGDE